MDRAINDEHLRHVPLNGDALDALGIPCEHGDEIARELNLGQTHYPNGSLITWKSLSPEEQRAGASWWKRTQPKAPPAGTFVTKAEVNALIVAARDELLDALTLDLTDLFGARDAKIKELKEAFAKLDGEMTHAANEFRATLAGHKKKILHYGVLIEALELKGPGGGQTGDHLRAEMGALEAKFAALEERQQGIAYEGVWRENASYKKDAAITYNGSMWVALRETKDRPPSDAWQLAVRHGRDARR